MPQPKDAFGTPTRLKPDAAAMIAAGGAALPSETPPATTVDRADLKRKSVRGGTVTMLSQGISITVQLTSTVILARLLSPNDYGVIAMVMAVTAFAGLFRDLGLSSAAIQKKDLTRAQQSNLFWLNVAMGSLLTILVAAASPLVAWFYGKPELTAVTVALSFTFLIGSFGTQHGAMLVRNMQFGRQAVAGISGSLVTLLTAVAFAVNGYSYWSLVWGNIAGSLTTTGLLFALSPFRPGTIAKGTGIRDMLRFGANVTAFDLVNYFHRNLDNILIGKFWGTEALGLYSRAYALLMLPINSLRGPITAVGFPAMSQLQDHPGAYRSYYCKVARILALASMPMAGLLFLNADLLIPLLLGDAWIKVIPIFSILAFVALVQPVITLWGMVLLSLGLGRRYLKLGILNTLLTVLGFTLGIRWGPMGIALGYMVATYVGALPILYLAFRDTPVRVRDFWSAIGPSLITCLTSGALTYFIKLNVASMTLPLNLIFVSGTFIGLAFLILRFLPGGVFELDLIRGFTRRLLAYISPSEGKSYFR